MRTLIAVLLLSSSVWAQDAHEAAKAIPDQGPPPKHLTLRPDGHVSANQDPKDRDKFDVHVVKQGETLSAIAGDVLKNPKLWPQLWEQNEHIINPHWIYPEDVILVKPVTILSEAKPPEPDSEPDSEPAPQADAKPAPVAASVRRPVQAPAQPQAPPALALEQQKPATEIKYDDLYCSGSVRTGGVPQNLKVLARFGSDDGALAAQGDYVYVSQGAGSGIAVGATYQAVRPTKHIDGLGTHYLDVAQVRVILVQPDFSLARVVHSCADSVDAGDILLPFQRISFPEPARPRPFSPVMTTTSGVAGEIVATKDALLNFSPAVKTSGKTPGAGGHLDAYNHGVAGESGIVYINVGQDKVRPGDVFVVYRDFKTDKRGIYHYPKEVKKLNNARRAIGELVVVKTGERAATALVTYASDGLISGDAVERR